MSRNITEHACDRATSADNLAVQVIIVNEPVAELQRQLREDGCYRRDALAASQVAADCVQPETVAHDPSR